MIAELRSATSQFQWLMDCHERKAQHDGVGPSGFELIADIRPDLTELVISSIISFQHLRMI